MDLASYFKGLLGRIEPDAKYVAAAKSAHEKLRKELRDDKEIGEAHLDTYLSGSYARHTAIHQIKDVDVICVLDLDWKIAEPNMVLAFLQDALQRYYLQVRAQARSVRVTTEDDVSLDIVPGAPISDPSGPLRIPDRKAEKWVTSHPKGQIAFAKRRNEDTGGYFVQSVKLLKHWRDRLPLASMRPKSYVLEVLVAGALSPSPPASHAAGIVTVLEGIWRAYAPYVDTGRAPQIPDPGYPANSVSKHWEATDFDAFIRAVDGAAKTARSAWGSTDEATAISGWRKLFGSGFAPPE